MKHLDLRFYWLRDKVAKGWTSDMPADILMKVAKPKVLEMVQMLGLGTMTGQGSVELEFILDLSAFI